MNVFRRFSTANTLFRRIPSVAVVGSGPAGFYAASRILLSDRAQAIGDVRIDMYERLPVPYGLVRSGVAPDHPEVKNCQHRFEEVAQHPNFRFYGNVNVESSDTFPSSNSIGQVNINDLRKHYDAVLLTYGAAYDRSLGLPHENSIPNVISARSFVHWYNGYPTVTERNSPLVDLRKVKHVTIIGQGNVAIDCARILLSRESSLAHTDMPQNILSELREANIESVDLVGRRGPLQLAATVAEMRELLNLDSSRFQIATPWSTSSQDPYKQDENTMAMINESIRLNSQYKDQETRKRKRTMELLLKHQKAMSATISSPQNENIKNGRFLFNLSPKSWDGAPGKPVSEITWTVNQLSAPNGSVFPLVPTTDTVPTTPSSADFPPSTWSAKRTDETVTTKTDLVLVSIGYRSVGIPGLPFDERRGIIPNKLGRVLNTSNEQEPGLYVSGWLATGPTGVIGSTMVHAFSVADQIISDLSSKVYTSSSIKEKEDIDPSTFIKPVKHSPSSTTVSDKENNSSNKPLVVDWTDWTAIDVYERKTGQSLSKEREKVTLIPEMLNIVSRNRQ